jgi:GDP-D-mannose 3', 5'-epimerase
MDSDGCLSALQSDFKEPLNLGSCEMVSMNEMMETIKTFDGKTLPIKHIPGPEGVRGRNSDNQLILEKLGWEPTIKLADGLKVTYFWIKSQVRPACQTDRNCAS